MREFSIPPLGRTWSVWSSVAACLLSWWHSKVLKLNASEFMHGSGLGVVWGMSLLRAVVAGRPPQSGVSKARWYGGWEGAFLRLMGEVARRVGV